MYVTIGCVNPTGTRYCSSWLPYYLNALGPLMHKKGLQGYSLLSRNKAIRKTIFIWPAREATCPLCLTLLHVNGLLIITITLFQGRECR